MQWVILSKLNIKIKWTGHAGPMGAEQSNLASEEAEYAFHVLRVDENSPAAVAKLVPHFDYIVSIQETPNVVAEMAKNHMDRPMKMAVYNSRLDTTRTVSIVPSHGWGGKTALGTHGTIMLDVVGASIRYCKVTEVNDRVWHVIDVSFESPAHRAGLIPQKDWIIGSPDIALNSSDDFYHLMIHNQKKPVRLLVFNIDQEAVREAVVIPDFDWGGQGCLGCDVASGALHRIVPPTGPFPVLIEGETTPSILGTAAYQDTRLDAPTTINRIGPGAEAIGVLPLSAVPPSSMPISHAPPPSTTLPSGSVAHHANLQPIPGFEVGGSDDVSFLQ